jgi:hypothetical protein
MSNAAWALQKAVIAALVADAGINAELGGPQVFDRPARNHPFPYVTLSSISTEDWSTGTDTGARHLLTFHAWSETGGRRQVSAIAEALRKVLHDSRLDLVGHALIGLRHESTEIAQRREREPWQAILRFRATTEQI